MNICYCHTCERPIQSLGIARHRAMHRDKRQDCVIEFSDGRAYRYEFAGKRPFSGVAAALEKREKAERNKCRDQAAFTRGKKDGREGNVCRSANGSYVSGYEIGLEYRKAGAA